MSGQIVNDYETLKSGAQAMSQFGQSLQQMGRQFKQIHQQLQEHCSGDESGLGAAVQGATSDTAEAGGDVFAEGGRVLAEMGSRTDTNTERTFGTDQTIADTFDNMAGGGLASPASDGGDDATAAESPRAPADGKTGDAEPPLAGASKRIEDARPYRSGGLAHDDPKWQHEMQDAYPVDANGKPIKYADPRGSWLSQGNDGGTTVPGRANNCADCSRSFLESWYGQPTCAQPRIVDPGLGPHDLQNGEVDSIRNMRDWAGGAETVESNSLSSTPASAAAGYQKIADKLQAAGPGSAAVVEVFWKGTDQNGNPCFNGGHAFNAVNHQGDVLWVDMQSGAVSENPLYLHAGAVASIVLGANGKKI